MADEFNADIVRELTGCPRLQDGHEYVLGVEATPRTNSFAPLKSYASQEELRLAYRNLLIFYGRAHCNFPIPLRRRCEGGNWQTSRYTLLDKLMIEVGRETGITRKAETPAKRGFRKK